MSDQEKSFWSSLQGILTGLAALITALTGLYLAINGSKSTLQPKTNPPITTPKAGAEPTSPAKPAAVAIVTPGPTSPGVTLVKPNADSTAVIPPAGKAPFPETGPLVDCTLFPTVNSLASLMSWSNNYHKQIIAADGVNRRAISPCNQTIDYRGMAHCKAKDNPEIRQALLETLTLCRAVGIEWQDIQHSTILGQE